MAQITLNSSGVASSGSLLLQTNGTTTQATVDTSGNLGIGVTPSAWDTTNSVKALQVSTGTSLWGLNYTGSQLYTFFGTNVYRASGGTDRYLTSAAATQYVQNAGAHWWNVAASGTAGNAITFTQAMTLDASGNLGVGTTSPYAKIHATGTIKVATGNAQGILALGDGNGTTVNCGIWRGSANAPTTDGNYLNLGGYDGVVFATGAASIGSQTERARIDSSGNLLVGSTSPIFSHSKTVQVTAANGSVPYSCVNSGYAARTWKFGAEGVGGAYIVFNGSDVGAYISYGGTSWTATSDERLKTDLIPIENAAQKVSTLRAVTGRYKTDDETVSRAFLIAQDVQAVLPQAVTEQGDENKTLGLAYSEVIPLLVAAIKEQQAIITQLQADVAALKG